MTTTGVGAKAPCRKPKRAPLLDIPPNWDIDRNGGLLSVGTGGESKKRTESKNRVLTLRLNCDSISTTEYSNTHSHTTYPVRKYTTCLSSATAAHGVKLAFSCDRLCTLSTE